MPEVSFEMGQQTLSHPNMSARELQGKLPSGVKGKVLTKKAVFIERGWSDLIGSRESNGISISDFSLLISTLDSL